jgi:hypothetical protein
MMALPFVTLFVGLICAWRGHRSWGIGFWIATLGLLVVLFWLHATSALHLQF